jgi:protein-S-isoprenylcysteine O-methyltransferase Ste14
MDDNTAVTPSHPGAPIQDKVKPPARPKGPNAAAIVVGLVAMVFAGLIIAKETLSWRIDWSHLGPGAIVGIGVVMVVIGAIGLVRRRDNL